MRVLSTLLCCLLLAFQAVAAQTDYAQHIASLIDPAKLATLGKRGACAWRIIIQASSAASKPRFNAL